MEINEKLLGIKIEKNIRENDEAIVIKIHTNPSGEKYVILKLLPTGDRYGIPFEEIRPELEKALKGTIISNGNEKEPSNISLINRVLLTEEDLKPLFKPGDSVIILYESPESDKPVQFEGIIESVEERLAQNGSYQYEVRLKYNDQIVCIEETSLQQPQNAQQARAVRHQK